MVDGWISASHLQSSPQGTPDVDHVPGLYYHLWQLVEELICGQPPICESEPKRQPTKKEKKIMTNPNCDEF